MTQKELELVNLLAETAVRAARHFVRCMSVPNLEESNDHLVRFKREVVRFAEQCEESKQL